MGKAKVSATRAEPGRKYCLPTANGIKVTNWDSNKVRFYGAFKISGGPLFGVSRALEIFRFNYEWTSVTTRLIHLNEIAVDYLFKSRRLMLIVM